MKLFFDENSKEVVWDDFEDTCSGHGRVEIRSCTATSDAELLKERHSGWQNLKYDKELENSQEDRQAELGYALLYKFFAGKSGKYTEAYQVSLEH